MFFPFLFLSHLLPQGFSTRRDIKTGTRNRLSEPLLSMLMFSRLNAMNSSDNSLPGEKEEEEEDEVDGSNEFNCYQYLFKVVKV
jgi:hypothetical protein